MSHTPTPYKVRRLHFAAPEIVATIKRLTRRVAIVLLDGGSEGMEEAIANAAFIVEACNAYERLKKERDGLFEAANVSAGAFLLIERWCCFGAAGGHRAKIYNWIKEAMHKTRRAIALCEGGAE